jgi:transcriptional antiterminator
MSDESENVSLQFLGKQMERMFSELEEVGLAVASLSVSNRHIRADVSKILANQEQHDARIKRIEQHLGLTDA